MASERRPHIDGTHRGVFRALIRAAQACREALRDAGLDDGVIELVNTRVSQINGCANCLSTHLPAARRAGVSQYKLDLLPSWRELELFTPVERAALHIAESLTCLEVSEDRTPALPDATEYLSTEQIAALEWTTVLINAFNRVAIASGHPPVPEPSD